MIAGAMHLVRDEERVREVEALAEAVGGRAGLHSVLDDLDRSARRRFAPGTSVRESYALDLRDSLTLRWWPQGITSSADHSAGELFAGRRVLVTSSYSKKLRGTSHGSRVTFFDVSDPAHVRYRHVLLVAPAVTAGAVSLRALRIHAGGLVWHRDHLHVAGTARGIFTFCLDDIVRLDRSALSAHGYRYVLPPRFRYVAAHELGVEPMRYSFLSLDASDGSPRLLAGEYADRGQSTRLVTYALDPASGLLLGEEGGVVRPLRVDDPGVRRMQGAVAVGGQVYVTQSHGRMRRGSLWSGPIEALSERPHALPPGPEDVCFWPSTQRLWSASEHPLLRYLFSVDAGHR